MVKKILNETAFKLYNAGWAIAVPFLKKKQRLAEGFKHRILDGTTLPQSDIWIQAASGGEAYLALELLKRICFDTPLNIIVTTNTTQGLEILEKGVASFDSGNIQLTVTYSPFDHPRIIGKAVKLINPKVMILLELELWPGLLNALKHSNCKTIIINGRLTQKSLKGYLKWPSLWRDIAPCDILAISEVDATRFKSIFPEASVDTMNNIKFDRVMAEDLQTNTANPLSPVRDSKRSVIVLGSVRAEEEEFVGRLICYLVKTNPDVVVWLFPRHMERVLFWQQFLKKTGLNWGVRSDKKDTGKSEDVLLWDRFGELSYAYEIADAAFVGGSLAPLGGQNFLEVLSAGLLPVTGPSWENFLWTGEEIIEQHLLYKEENWQKVAERLLKQILYPVSREDVRAMLAEYIESRKGGTQAACEKIKELYYENC